MELNFIDLLVQAYIDQFNRVNRVTRQQYIDGSVQDVDVQVKQFPEELRSKIRDLISIELDKLNMDHDCPTFEQLESFDFWDNGNANNIYTCDLMPDNTSDDVKEVLNQYTYELVYQKVTENMECVTIDGEVFYIDEDGTELGLDDIEIYPNANAIYKHMYKVVKLTELDLIPEVPDEFEHHPEVIKFNAICDQLMQELMFDAGWDPRP